MRVCALAALALMGCGVYEEAPPTDAPNWSTQVWLAPESPGYAAQQAWGLPLPWQPEFVVADEATLQAQCGIAPDSGAVGGCTDLDGHTVWLWADMDPALWEPTVLHEIGHVISKRGHIESPACGERNDDSTYVMCTFGAVTDAPTETDFEWVTWGHTKTLRQLTAHVD